MRQKRKKASLINKIANKVVKKLSQNIDNKNEPMVGNGPIDLGPKSANIVSASQPSTSMVSYDNYIVKNDLNDIYGKLIKE